MLIISHKPRKLKHKQTMDTAFCKSINCPLLVIEQRATWCGDPLYHEHALPPGLVDGKKCAERRLALGCTVTDLKLKGVKK